MEEHNSSHQQVCELLVVSSVFTINPKAYFQDSIIYRTSLGTPNNGSYSFHLWAPAFTSTTLVHEFTHHLRNGVLYRRLSSVQTPSTTTADVKRAFWSLVYDESSVQSVDAT
ncbi:hypothetical protein Ancab_037750 [Ancistrocladus abbreviatus]